MTLAWQYLCFFASAFHVTERETPKYPLAKIEAKEKAKIHSGNLSLLFVTISFSEQIHLVDFFGYFEVGCLHYFPCLFTLQMLRMQELHTAL